MSFFMVSNRGVSQIPDESLGLKHINDIKPGQFFVIDDVFHHFGGGILPDVYFRVDSSLEFKNGGYVQAVNMGKFNNYVTTISPQVESCLKVISLKEAFELLEIVNLGAKNG